MLALPGNLLKMQPSFQFSEIVSLATATIGQSQNERWKMERNGRILASSIRDTIELGQELKQANMMQCPKYSADVLKKIRWRRHCLYNFKDMSYRTAVQWGVEKEALARTSYEKMTGYRVEQTGLWIFPSGSVCCSPDGLVFNSQGSKRPDGLLEIKCPYKLSNGIVVPKGSWSKFIHFLKSDFELNQDDRFYHLIQAELYATRTKWCDVFIWTPSQTRIFRIERNESWIETNVPLLEWVFKKYIYPLCRKCDWKKYCCGKLDTRDWAYRKEVYSKNKRRTMMSFQIAQ